MAMVYSGSRRPARRFFGIVGVASSLLALFWLMVWSRDDQHLPAAAETSINYGSMSNEPSIDWDKTFVPKEHFSSTTRFLFIAGLGGVGHHGWLAALKKGEVCRSAYDAEKALKELWFGKDTLADEFAQNFKDILASTKESIERSDQGGGVICLNVRLAGGHMFSYPESNDPKHHPNVYTLALLAEEVGVDLRIVVQHRHPAPQLVSLSVHRNFLPLPSQAHQMTNQAAMLNSQLSLIDPQFFVCAGFDSLGDLRYTVEEHVIGSMVTVPPHRLSTAIQEYYRANIDDPNLAWSEIAKQKDGQNLKIKILEMNAYYSHLKESICPK